MIFMNAWKMFLNEKKEMFTDVVGGILRKRLVEPDDVLSRIFRRFTLVFIFDIWWFILKFVSLKFVSRLI